ncbi:MAG TPA: hypothetical protein VKR56_11105 [Candidatus Cybelea sp.]|nr:hypothetical protein [Candidatus Cybelea sp.]
MGSPATSVARKLEHELREYAVAVLYLTVCFGAINFYSDALLNAHGVSYWSYGWGLIKALILAKFILVGQTLHLGERYATRRFIYVVAVKALVFLVFLVILSFVENAIVGFFHGQGLSASSATFGGTLPLLLATCLIMLLILIPFLAFRELNEALGEGGLRKLLFEPRAGRRRAR